MALKVLRADPFTRSELGPRGLEELSRNLWPGNCQTCSGSLKADTPSVVIMDHGSTVTATLHHSGCQRPRWERTDVSMVRRHLSTTVRMVSIPFGDPSEDTFMPTLLANPGLEEVTLVCTDSGRYRATTVDSFRPLGLVPPAEGLVRGIDPTVTAWLDDQRLTARCGDLYWLARLVPEERGFAEEIRRRGGVVLGISTAVEPRLLENMEPLKRALKANDIALAFLPINTTEAAPNLAGHSVLVESDLAHADEANDLDWLPAMPYSGPSYDPATGQFKVGMGMDQPNYWRLNTPGVRVENGLIAGPPDIGKTNVIRMVMVEALCSGRFTYALADPLNRNRLVDVLGEHAFAVATAPDSTMDLLARIATFVTERANQPERFRDPTPESPGLLVALDDAHEVLRDPHAAALAAHIATAGPSTGVGLIVSTASIELDDFAGRRDLVVALSSTNSMVFRLDWVERLRELHESR